jgi:hypothetical protein
MRFSAGLEKSRAKAQSLAMKRFSAGLNSPAPPAEAGGTKLGMERSGAFFSGSHADALAAEGLSGGKGKITYTAYSHLVYGV